MPLAPRQKKLIIIVATVPFLLLYTGLAVTVADYVPGHWLIQLIFYVLAGTLWAFPLKPVMKWMNRDPDFPEGD